MRSRKLGLAAGIAGLTLALPAGYAVFHFLADSYCDPGDCYGEPAWVPLVMGLIVASSIAAVGLSFIDANILAYARERVFARIAWIFVIGALPTGWATAQIVSDRYCDTGCSGDYLVMGMASVLAAIAMIGMSLGLSVIAFVLARRPTRGGPQHKMSSRSGAV